VDVRPVKNEDTHQWLLNRHYAKRLCPISYAFGLFDGSDLVGVVTYGTPVSSPLRVGVCGESWSGSVVELNRLVCEEGRNYASILVGGSLRLLPKPKVVVSYADTAQGHVGYVYQATNFIYTGLSAKRTDWHVDGLDHLHGATIADMSRGQENRAEYMRDRFGDDFSLVDRPRKHRYIYFCGSKRERKQMAKDLMYGIEDYPKGDTNRYDASGYVEKQQVMF